MTYRRFTEKELLRGLDATTAHADELVEPLSQELTPLEQFKGSVIRYDRPTDPVWDEYFDSDDGVSDEFMEDQDFASRSTTNTGRLSKGSSTPNLAKNNVSSHQSYISGLLQNVRSISKSYGLCSR